MLSADKVSEIFCIADDFCQEFDHQIENLSLPLDGKKHRRRKGQMSDSGLLPDYEVPLTREEIFSSTEDVILNRAQEIIQQNNNQK